jgi:lantibiotic modifying enzyme
MPSRRDIIRQGIAASALLGMPRALAALVEDTDSVAQGSGRRVESRSITARPHLDAALRAERWIRRSRQVTADGVRWPADPLKPDVVATDLYNGMGGVVAFYLELYNATGDKQHLREASAGADYLISRVPSIPPTVSTSPGGAVRRPDCGLYTGLAGTMYLLERAHAAGAGDKYRDAAQRCLTLITGLAQPAGNGAEWSTSTDIVSGTAGTGLALLRAHRTLGGPSALATARRAGTRLIELGRPADGGTMWMMAPDYPRNMPNFSHGTAGVAYFLARLHEETGDPAFRDAARAGARYLQAVATKHGDACAIHHHDPDGKDLFYLSWCHGPAGTARLFYQLGTVGKDADAIDWVHRLARGITTTPIPEQRTPGFWNNISQCCGNIGVAQFFLDLHRTIGHPGALDFARRCLADTMSRATEEDGGLKWIQAENRTQPENLVAQTGFMQGAAGVGTFLLHLDGFEQKRAPAVVFPDSPFVS